MRSTPHSPSEWTIESSWGRGPRMATSAPQMFPRPLRASDAIGHQGPPSAQSRTQRSQFAAIEFAAAGVSIPHYDWLSASGSSSSSFFTRERSQVRNPPRPLSSPRAGAGRGTALRSVVRAERRAHVVVTVCAHCLLDLVQRSGRCIGGWQCRGVRRHAPFAENSAPCPPARRRRRAAQSRSPPGRCVRHPRVPPSLLLSHTRTDRRPRRTSGSRRSG